jgi:thioredoxin-dependent peroxiredoxin
VVQNQAARLRHVGNHLYRLYGREKSWRRLVTTFVTPWSALATIREGFYATFVKGCWPGKIDAGIHRMPADFLIGPHQVVKKAYYGTYPGHHLPFEEDRPGGGQRAVAKPAARA